MRKSKKKSLLPPDRRTDAQRCQHLRGVILRFLWFAPHERPKIFTDASLMFMFRSLGYDASRMSHVLLHSLLGELRKRRLVSFTRDRDGQTQLERALFAASSGLLRDLPPKGIFDIRITERGIAVVDRAIEDPSVFLSR
jgi:hypothetical protein